MADPNHLEVLKKGAKEWNKWRNENPPEKINLIQANLSGVNLSGVNLSGVNLSGVNLCGANLIQADLIEARLIGANLSEARLMEARLMGAGLVRAGLVSADLGEADLREADLGEADLREADLRGANLIGADLRFANLSGAKFAHSLLGSMDLAHCLGLEEGMHFGPSIVDARTIKFDYKNLPENFLAGCGFSNWQIESIKLNDPELKEPQITEVIYKIDRLRSGSPIQFFNLFISYSRKDEPIVEVIEEKLKKKDIRCWRDVHDLVAGPIEKQIDRAINMNKTVLLVLSEHSVKSDWVEYEVTRARDLEKTLSRHVLCPVALDDSWKSPSWSNVLMNQVKKYNILDFSKWQEEKVFEEQFDKLLKGLDIFYREKSE